MREFNFIEKTKLNQSEKEIIQLLWNQEYPVSIQQKTIEDFENYLIKLEDKHHVLIVKNNEILGWYCDFIRNYDRWFAMILAEEIQGRGIGRKLIEKAKNNNKILNGWVVISSLYAKKNGANYKSPLGFYKKVGFTIFENEVFESEALKTVKIQWKSK